MKVSLEIGGFTPVFDCVALYVGQNGKKLGVVTAIVFGAAWRYCQMEKGVCDASIETIAERAGVSPKTAQRHIKVLCEEGFLKDLTPDVRNRPHEYADTGKAKMEGNLDAKIGRSESPAYESGRSESPTEVGQRVLPRSVRESVEESPLRDSSKRGRKDSSSSFSGFEKIIAEICGIKLDGASKNKIQQVQKAAKALEGDGVTADQIVAFGQWWPKDTPPRASQICDEWGQFEASLIAELTENTNALPASPQKSNDTITVPLPADLVEAQPITDDTVVIKSPDAAATWGDICLKLKNWLPQAVYDSHIKVCHPANLDLGGVLTIEVLSPLSYTWLTKRLYKQISDAALSVDRNLTLAFTQGEAVPK